MEMNYCKGKLIRNINKIYAITVIHPQQHFFIGPELKLIHWVNLLYLPVFQLKNAIDRNQLWLAEEQKTASKAL